jgi:hypothetical protein
MKPTLSVVALSLAATLMTASVASATTTTLRTSYVTFYFQVLDNPPLQASPTLPPSAGDVALIRSRYSQGGTTVAFERTTCTVIDWPNVVCDINLQLRSGHIISTDQLNANSRATQRLAITGGTGAYRNARGEIALRQTSETRGTAVFTIIT